MAVGTKTALVGCDEIVTVVKPGRLMSIDLLRGLTIGFMILVNNNGSSAAYAELQHSAWNGFTATDLVFPTFLFLVGVSTVFSTASRLARGDSKQSLFLHTLRRAVILFLLGLLVNSFPHFHWHTLRFYGVLPRIAICYFVVATLYLISPKWKNMAVLAVALLVGYWALMRFVSVPGYGVPVRDVPLLDPDRNLVAWLDRHIFAASHLYERTRDPEGLLSTLPALATTLIGLLTGIWLRTQRALMEKVRGIAVVGVSCVVLGLLWNFSFPINKKLWTSSFVLFAVGWSLLLLAVSIWMFDKETDGKTTPAKRSRWFTPLLVFGSNAITAYVFSELLAGGIGSIVVRPRVNLQHWLANGILSVVPYPAFASLLYSLGFVAVCWLPAYWLYRRRIFIKV
ncbi:MAG TPA: heparan-alpha-glucosaminide N-acetyltransferase domain-containing protein [Edaphobacter sp.]|nr:heparan-alpha-glucosaminide N-acetyltransferase domain-containing protein [Edaphobacter sp.]